MKRNVAATTATTTAATTAQEMALLKRANVDAARRAATLSAEAHSAMETAKHMELNCEGS